MSSKDSTFKTKENKNTKINSDDVIYGFSIKDLIVAFLSPIISILVKEILSNIINSTKINTKITINFNQTFFFFITLSTIFITIVLRRNKRIKKIKSEQKVLDIKKIHEQEIEHIKEGHKRNIEELEDKHKATLQIYELYPNEPINYDYTVECSRQDMIFHSKENIDFIRLTTLNNIECNELRFKYFWSGSNVKKIYLDDDIGKYEIILPEKLSDKSLVIPPPTSYDYLAMSSAHGYPLGGDYTIVPSNGNFESTETTKVIFELTNADNKMDTSLSMNIQRPTDKLILCLTFPQNLKIKNIMVKRKLLFGDYKSENLPKQNYTLDKKKHGITSTNKAITYKLIINHPTMFYCYSIDWEWK